MNQKQQSFTKTKSSTSHGGAPSKGKRKGARPLDRKKWIHMILKSSKAKGPMSFHNPKHKQWIEDLIREKAKKFGVQIADMVNVGNHFHYKIKIHNRELFQNFLKSITSLIARQVTGAKKGNPFGQFWDGLAFTRVLKSSFEELQLRGYFQANRIQVKDSYMAREGFLDGFNQWLAKKKGKSGFMANTG